MDFAYPDKIHELPQGVGIFQFSKFHECFFISTPLKEMSSSHLIPKQKHFTILVVCCILPDSDTLACIHPSFQLSNFSRLPGPKTPTEKN